MVARVLSLFIRNIMRFNMQMRVWTTLWLPMLCAGTTAGGHAIRSRPAVRRQPGWQQRQPGNSGNLATAAGNLVTTAGAAQLRGLTVAFRRPPLMDPYCARGAGGLSTLLLLLPGLVARRRGDARRARWYGIQTAIAFFSDYVMIGSLSICHGIDRLCASYTFASLTLRAWRGSPTPPQRSGPQQGAPAGEAPRARPRLVRVGCLAAGVPALWCKARAAEAAQRGEARCEPSSVAPRPWRPGHGARAMAAGRRGSGARARPRVRCPGCDAQGAMVRWPLELPFEVQQC